MEQGINKTPLDLVWGADAIARVIDRTAAQTFHMLQKGALPARKVGGRWVADREQLRAFMRGERIAA